MLGPSGSQSARGFMSENRALLILALYALEPVVLVRWVLSGIKNLFSFFPRPAACGARRTKAAPHVIRVARPAAYGAKQNRAPSRQGDGWRWRAKWRAKEQVSEGFRHVRSPNKNVAPICICSARFVHN